MEHPLTFSQHGSEVDVPILYRLAQTFVMDMTKQAVEVVYAIIHVRLGDRTPGAIVANTMSFVGTRNLRRTLARLNILALSVRPDLNRNITQSFVSK